MQVDRLTTELFNSFTDALCLIDEQGIVVHSNQKYHEVFSPENNSAHKFISNFSTEYHSEIQTLLNDSFTNSQLEFRTEKELTLLNNKKIWFEFTISSLNDNGQNLKLLVIRDVNQKKNIEFNLLKSEDKYRNVFNQANDAMLVCYLNYGETMGNYIEVNEVASKSLEYSKDELLNMNPTSLMFNNSEVEIIRIIEKLWTDKHTIFNNSFTSKTGKIFPAEISAHLFDLNDRPAVLFIARDLSQREEAENKIKQASLQLRNLALHLQNIREEERALIAREIHDELGQILTFLKIQITLVGKKLNNDQQVLKDKIDSSLKLIDDSVDAVQKLTSKLRPTLLDELGIAAAIEWQIQDFKERTGIDFEISLPKDEPELEKDKLTAIFRIFQEALTNVARHANATKIFVTMNEFKNNLILEIKDNGKGITQSQVNSPKSLGVLGMKERALVFGGAVIIKSSMKSGTTVRVEIPIE